MCYEVGAEISRYCERSTIHELCWRTTQIFLRCCLNANRRTHSSSCFQLGPVSLGHRADLRWWWNLLTSLAIDDHSCEVNCDLSDEMCSGMPKRAIQWQTSAWAQLEVVVLLRGIASGQWEKQSTTVNKWVYTLEGGRGPTRSTCMWPNRCEGFLKVSNEALVCVWIFPAWHAMHSLARTPTCFCSLVQINFEGLASWWNVWMAVRGCGPSQTLSAFNYCVQWASPDQWAHCTVMWHLGLQRQFLLAENASPVLC